jgi:diguanylate cyclase (GGDEF)-like protein
MLIVGLLSLLLIAAAAAVVFDRARTEAAGLRLLVEMSGLLQVSTSFGEAVEIVPVFGRHLFPALDGALYLRNGSHYELATSWGRHLEHGGQAILPVRDFRDAHQEHDRQDCLSSTLSLELHAGREILGVLQLRAPDGASLASRTSLFASAFADSIALALSNLRLQETLRARAMRDSLTGLFNRRYMEEALTRELRDAHARHAQTGVILVDVDHFKPFNDTFGHGAGDALLMQLSRVMQNAFDGDEYICRYGGDEFVIVLPDTRPDVLRDSAERLRDAVNTLRIHDHGRDLGSITISTGIAYAPDHANTVNSLIAAADRALYNAKTAGRNRVASPPPQALGLDAA